jgi:HD-like signal output (HDOD) protein
MPDTLISRDTLLEAVRTMPSAPRILAELAHLLDNPDSELAEIAQLLKRDAALTARIIRVSNSTYYNTGTPHASLEDALARVGFTEVYRLTGFATAAQLADERLTFYRIKGIELRDNSLLSALIIETLAKEVKIDPRVAYTAGLLRSLGKIALNRIAREQPGGVDAQADESLVLREIYLAGVSNCEVTAMILQAWGFADVTVEAIRHHYLTDPLAPPLARLLNIAAGMTERCGFGLRGETYYVEPVSSTYEALGISAPTVEEAVVRAYAIFSSLRETGI